MDGGEDLFTKLPPLARICIISFLGNAVVSLDTAFCSKEARKALLKEIFPKASAPGMIFRTEELPAWNAVNPEEHHGRLCDGLKWAAKKGIDVRDFVLEIPGKEHADHLWLLIHRQLYALAEAVITKCERSYDVNQSNKYFRTPLHYAVNDPLGGKLVGLLCARSDTFVDCLDRVRRTPLMWACVHGVPTFCETLLKAGSQVDLKDRNGETGLHFAALGGNLECVVLLIKNKAKVNKLDKALTTPLKKAGGDQEVVDYLRSEGGQLQDVVLARRKAARASGFPRDSDDSEDELDEDEVEIADIDTTAPLEDVPSG